MNLVSFIYLFCALACLFCTVLLFFGFRRTGARLLFWSGVCFVCLTINNILVLLDVSQGAPQAHFLTREIIALSGLSVLLYGFIWEVD